MGINLADVFVTLKPQTGHFESEAKAEVEDATRDLSATVPLKADDRPARKTIDGMGARIKLLGELAGNVKLGLNDKDALSLVTAFQAALIRLNRTVASPDVDDAGMLTAEAKVLAIEHQLDKIDGRRVTADVVIKEHRSLLSRLPGVGGGGGDAGTAAGAGAGGAAKSFGNISGAFASLPAPVQIGGIAAALAALPFAAQVAAGGIVTALGGALTGVAILGAAKAKSVKDSFADLAKHANADLVTIGKPFVPVLNSVAQTAGRVLGALTGPLQGFARVVAGPFKQFADTLIRAFGQPAVKQSIRAVATAFGDILKALTPQLAGDIGDVATGVTKIAKAVSANPKAFADFISFLFKVAGAALTAIGWLTRVATYVEEHFGPAMHRVAVIFDGVRHDIAHTWDQIFENSVGMVIRFVHNVETQFNSWRHGIAVVFDGVRHDIAHVWDIIYNNSIGTVIRFVTAIHQKVADFRHDVAGVFDGLRHDVAKGWDALWSGLQTATQAGVKAVGIAWNVIKNAVKAPINFVIGTVLDHGLIAAFNFISSKVGGPHIGQIKTLARGGLLPGYGGGDSVPALLEPGEAVVDKARTRRYAGVLGMMGVPGFAAGGKVGNPAPGRFQGLAQPKPGSEPFGGGVLSKIMDVGKIMAALASGNTTALTNAFYGLMGHGVGGAVGDLAKLLVDIPKLLVKDAVHDLLGLFSSTAGGGGSGSAIASYALSFLGKIPYRWGGTAVPGGADCSGFTQAVYKHFGYNAPRTSEEQGAWVKRSAPTSGALVFFNSPAGGPPPGHVGIATTGGKMVSQAGPEGALGPTIGSIAGRMFAGIPPGGFATSGGSAKGRWTLGGLEGLWDRAGGPGSRAHIAAAIALAESGGNPRARNPSGASGLWQILGQVVGGNIFDPVVNAENAVKKYRDAGGFSPWVTFEDGAYRRFMAEGGPVHSFDQGGLITEPVLGIGQRSGSRYGFALNGQPETVTPGRGRGAVMYVENQYVQDRTDAELIGQRVDWAISTGGF